VTSGKWFEHVCAVHPYLSSHLACFFHTSCINILLAHLFDVASTLRSWDPPSYKLTALRCSASLAFMAAAPMGASLKLLLSRASGLIKYLVMATPAASQSCINAAACVIKPSLQQVCPKG